MGTTLASFHRVGIIACENDVFKMLVTGKLNSYANSFFMQAGKSSGPPDFVTDVRLSSL